MESDSLADLRLHLVHNESKNPGHGDGNVFVRLFLLSFASHCIKLDFKSGLSRSVTKPGLLRWESVLNLKFGFAARNATAGRDFSPPFRACFRRVADYFRALRNNKQFIRVDVK